MSYQRGRMSRRGLLLGVGSGLAVPWLIPSSAWSAPGRPGPNERIGVGAIGVGNRASLLLEQLPENGRI
ncbi:MAG TPA: hypothetical protein PK777_09115, partial [Thermoguttaceae bacterium]|nr:hypothetical protein [Thermoguttaceae bacterium]